MNPFQFPNESTLSTGSFPNYSPSFPFQLIKDLQLEKEKNRFLMQELEKQKTKSKEYETGIFSILSKSKHQKNAFHGFSLPLNGKKTVESKKKIKEKKLEKHKKQQKY
jgi:predicted transcriptional regulator